MLLAPPTGAAASSGALPAEPVREDGRDWLRGVRFLHCDDATVEVGSWLSYHGPDAAQDTVALLERIERPVLVISGSEDETAPDLGTQMDDVDNALVQHVAIDGAGHFFRDLYGYDVVEAVVDFIAGLGD